MSYSRETVEELDKLIDSCELDERQVELLKNLKGQLVANERSARDCAVEKIMEFRAEFEKARGLLSEALTAIRMADDYASEVDLCIAKDIDRRLCQASALCRISGFGREHRPIG